MNIRAPLHTRSCRSLVCLMLCALLSTPTSRAQMPPEIEANEQGLYFLERGKAKESIPYFDKAIQIAPRMATAYMNRGSAYDDAGDPQKALADFGRAIEIDPYLGAAYLNRGLTLMRITQSDKALIDLSKSVQLRPNHARSYALRGLCYLALKKPHEALADFDRALKLDPSERLAVRGRGEALAMSGKPESAAADLERAGRMPPGASETDRPGLPWSPRAEAEANIEKLKVQATRLTNVLKSDPKNVEVLVSRASLSNRLNNPAQAIADATQVLKLAPNRKEAYRIRGEAYMRRDEYTGAISDLTAFIKASPGSSEAYMMRGAAYQNSRRHQEAVADLDKAVSLNPSDSRLYLLRGACNMAAGHTDQGLKDFSEWVARNPKFANAYVTRAGGYLAAGQPEKAIADCDQALALDANDSYAASIRGVAKVSLGRFDEALVDLNKSISKNPKDPKALGARADAYLHLGRNDEGMADLDAAIKLEPKHAKLYALRATVELEQNNIDQAFKDAEMAAALEPKQVLYMLLLAELYGKRNDKLKAMDLLAKAIELAPDNPIIYATRARYYGPENPGPALADLDKAISLSKEPDLKLLVMAATIKLQQGQPKDAIPYLDKALPKTKKDTWVVLYLRAQAKMAAHDYEGALQDWNNVVALPPEDNMAYLSRAHALIALGRNAEAMKDIDRALEIKPSAAAWLQKGGLELLSGKAAESIASFTKAIDMDDKLYRARMGRALAYMRNEQIDKAFEDSDYLLKINPDNPRAISLRGQLLEDKGDFEQAMQNYDRAASLDANATDVYGLRSVAAFKLGKNEQALKDAERYCKSVEWKDKLYPCITMIGYFSSARMGDSSSGSQLLGEARRAASSQSWPWPILDYLHGELSEKDLLSKASNNDELTEAHAYIGLNRQLKSDRKGAADNFEWVKQNGNRHFIEYDLAIKELERMGLVR